MKKIIPFITLMIFVFAVFEADAEPLKMVNLDWLKQPKKRAVKRDPFILPKVPVPQAQIPPVIVKPADRPSPAPELDLQAIIYSETGQPAAIINSRIVREGDRIDGMELINIEKDRVSIDTPAGKKVLEIARFSVK